MQREQGRHGRHAAAVLAILFSVLLTVVALQTLTTHHGAHDHAATGDVPVPVAVADDVHHHDSSHGHSTESLSVTAVALLAGTDDPPLDAGDVCLMLLFALAAIVLVLASAGPLGAMFVRGRLAVQGWFPTPHPGEPPSLHQLSILRC